MGLLAESDQADILFEFEEDQVEGEAQPTDDLTGSYGNSKLYHKIRVI